MTIIQRTFVLLILITFFVLFYFLQPILTPFISGIILAYLGDPLVDRLERLRVRRTVGVLLVFAVFFAVFATALLVVLPLVARELAAFIKNIPAFVRWLQETTSPVLIANFGVDPFDIKLDNLAVQVKDNWQQAGGVLGTLISRVTQSGFAFLAALGVLALTPVVAFYIMRDWDILMQRVREMIPRDLEPGFMALAAECDEVLGAFLRGQLLIMFLLGCIYAMGLTLVGLDMAILIGMLAGLMSIVPYLGVIVGILAATVAAIFQFSDVSHVVYVFIVFGLGQLLEGSVLTPWLVGDKIGMHPVAVIFAVLAGGQLFGFVGILLALPVAAVIMVFLRHAHQRYLDSEYYRVRVDHSAPPGSGE